MRARDAAGHLHIVGSVDLARAVGRFRLGGPLGYRAVTMPDAPLRQTRTEAEDDELAHRGLTRGDTTAPVRSVDDSYPLGSNVGPRRGLTVDVAPRRSGGRFDRQVVLVQTDPAVHVDVPLKQGDGFAELRVDVRVDSDVGVGEQDGSLRREDHGRVVSASGAGIGAEKHRLAASQSLADDPLDCGHDQVIGSERVLAAEVVDDDGSGHGGSCTSMVGTPNLGHLPGVSS